MAQDSDSALRYTYDLLSRRTGMTDHLDAEIGHTWDRADRLATLSQPWGGQIGFTYDAQDRRLAVPRASGANTTLATIPAGGWEALRMLRMASRSIGGRVADRCDQRGGAAVLSRYRTLSQRAGGSCRFDGFACRRLGMAGALPR
ncbi:hypothetical protein G8E03_02550 [Pontibrevibacter nitratireducens]|uniref:YD repeat-containing protein n=1 Tax=Pontivivens nitratireducens TaxID=2758038 RepID=A0A6G7VIH7_9RHOB|nr:hypothetical protein G8E03_02550 [Pontibrevibacter nitratireducens]